MAAVKGEGDQGEGASVPCTSPAPSPWCLNRTDGASLRQATDNDNHAVKGWAVRPIRGSGSSDSLRPPALRRAEVAKD